MSSVKYLPIKDLLIEIIDNRGKSVPTVEKGFPLIATNCIKHSSIYPTFDKVRYVDEVTMKTWFRAHLKPNDILFVNKGTPGRVCLVPDPVTFCAAQDMMGFRCNDRLINYKYLFAALRSDEIQKIIENNHVGLVIPHFRKQDLSSLLIPVKPRIEQDFIGEIYFILSKKIELNNRINAELEALAKTLYDYWFVQFEFPNDEGKPYKSSGGKMVWNAELKREVPEGWEVKNLTKEMDLQYGFPFSTELFNDNGIGVPVIRIRDILNCSISNYSTEEVDDKYRINKGDIIVGMDGNFHINYWNRDNCYLNQRSLRIRSNNGSISEIQARYSIEPFIQAREKNVSRTTVAHLSAKDVNDLKILKADNDFQTKANNCFKSILEKLVSNRIQNQKLSELRDWLLPMLMNGQVRVSER